MAMNDTPHIHTCAHPWEGCTLHSQWAATRQLCTPVPGCNITIYVSKDTHTHSLQIRTSCLLPARNQAIRIYAYPIKGLTRCLRCQIPRKQTKDAFSLEIWPHDIGTPLLLQHLTVLYRAWQPYSQVHASPS